MTELSSIEIATAFPAGIIVAVFGLLMIVLMKTAKETTWVSTTDGSCRG